MSFCPWKPQILVLCWQEWNPTWSSAVIAHLLRDSLFCACWDHLLTMVKSNYLSYYILYRSSNQSGHFQLTCLISKHFHPQNYPTFSVLSVFEWTRFHFSTCSIAYISVYVSKKYGIIFSSKKCSAAEVKSNVSSVPLLLCISPVTFSCWRWLSKAFLLWFFSVKPLSAGMLKTGMT